MAKDFWQQVFAKHHVPAVRPYSLVYASLIESTCVLATLWQRYLVELPARGKYHEQFRRRLTLRHKISHSALTVTAVGVTVGVSRETVHRWLREDCGFLAAMNRGKRELHEAAQSRLQSVWWKAADNLARAVDAGNLQASLVVLRGLGELSGLSPRLGTDDPQRLCDEKTRSERDARALQSLMESF